MYLFELVDIYVEDVHIIKKVFLHSILARPEKVSTYCDLRKEFLCNKNKIGFLRKSLYVSPEPAVQ